MRKIIFYCDKCGKQIEQEWNVVQIWDIYDLCTDCEEKVKQVIEDWLQDKPAAKPKKQAPNKVAIDMPKVHALMDAGWSYDKIGEEFGVSGQTISNRLKDEKGEN